MGLEFAALGVSKPARTGCLYARVAKDGSATVNVSCMKIGISLGELNPRSWIDATEEADRLGFESAWMPEHLVLPVEMSGSPNHGEEHAPVPPNVPVYDVLGYLSFLAGRTDRIRLGTNVYNIGLRHPFVTARAVATLDVVSGGRVEFGIGASWLRAEWDAVGLDFDTRGRRVDEAIGICRRLWQESVIEHHGEFFDFDPVMFEPKPVQQPNPPIVIGGDGPAALRRVATVADGWMPLNHTLEQLPPAIARLAELRAAAGRPGRTEVTVNFPVESSADLERYAEAGIDRVIVAPWRSSREAVEGIRRFADAYFD
jgi:probable F420-dependent oxidoreductase